jgi:hypothetical protein
LSKCHILSECVTPEITVQITQNVLRGDKLTNRAKKNLSHPPNSSKFAIAMALHG